MWECLHDLGAVKGLNTQQVFARKKKKNWNSSTSKISAMQRHNLKSKASWKKLLNIHTYVYTHVHDKGFIFRIYNYCIQQWKYF